jgi:hypothetical protein
MDASHWILAILLALGLAASTGLNAFLPLLMLAGAIRFHFAGITLNSNFAWLSSDLALIVLGIAAAVEIIADKIPAVDHALHAVGTFVRPVAGIFASASVLPQSDPAITAVMGLIIGTPVSAGFHTVKSGTRVASSAVSFGCLNPIISIIEDIMVIALVLIALFAPLLVPVFLALFGVLLWKMAQAARRKLALRKQLQQPLSQG